MCSVVCSPGTASCFCPNSGTQNEWITSFELIVSITERSFGNRSTADVSPCASGYVNDHEYCCAVTSTWSGFTPALPLRERTMALTIAIDVTITSGTIVQPISRPVWPWIGGPSESSPGAARNLAIS